jgi:hypothetical protein
MKRAQSPAASITRLPPERVTVHNHLLGGGFGRLDRVSEFASLSARHDADLDLHGLIILVLRRCFHLDQPVVSPQL